MTIEISSDFLGEIVTWDTGHGGVHDLFDIRNALIAAGLPDVTSDLNNMSAFSRATKELKENRSIDKVSKDSGGIVTFQLTAKENNGKSIDFSFETIITLNSFTGDISCPDAMIEQRARQLFAHAMQIRTSSDITRMVQKLFKEHADLYSINPNKGVAYFVPYHHTEFTKKVQQFIKEFGGTLYRWPVPRGTEEGNKSVQESVNNGLNAVLEELQEASNEWTTATHDSTMDKVVDKVNMLKFKASLYAEFLQTKQGELQNAIHAATNVILGNAEKVINEKAAAKAAWNPIGK
jgi:hypothetical protein